MGDGDRVFVCVFGGLVENEGMGRGRKKEWRN